MNEYEFLLQDRITKIQSIIDMYGVENFTLSFSGGMDSTVLSYSTTCPCIERLGIMVHKRI